MAIVVVVVVGAAGTELGMGDAAVRARPIAPMRFTLKNILAEISIFFRCEDCSRRKSSLACWTRLSGVRDNAHEQHVQHANIFTCFT